MKPPRPPVAVSILALLTAAYWGAEWLLDRDLAARPLEVPYHILRHMERDARLRSRAPADRVLPAQQFLQVWDFDTAERLDAQLSATAPMTAEWSPTSLLEGRGSVRVPVPATGIRLTLPVRTPEQRPSCLQLEGRLRLLGAAVPCEASLFLESATTDGTTRLVLQPGQDRSTTAALHATPQEPGAWWEFSISLASWDAAAPPDALALTLVTEAPTVEWDELVLRAAPRLRGLVTGGQPRNAGVTEGTRERKRFVRRGQDERLCLALAPPASLDLTLEVPERARLELGLSTLSEAVPRQAAEFTVAVSREGQFEEPLLRRSAGPGDASQFVDHSLDLSSMAGERVRLQLRVESADPTNASVVLLADPMLVARPPQAMPSVFLLTAPQEWLQSGAAARILEGALVLPRYHPADPDPERDLLSLLSSQPPTVEQDPRRLTGLVPRISNLVEVLRRHGYESFAATAPERRGPTLQGFTRRWADVSLGGDTAVREWIEPRVARPLLVLLDLPRLAPADTLVAWKKDLERQGLWQNAHVLLVPAGGTPGLALWRRPRAPPESRSVNQVLGALDLAPTLLAALELPPSTEFKGRNLPLWEVDGAEVPEQAGLAPHEQRGAATLLRLAPALPARFEVILDERQAAWPLPPGGPR